MSAASASRGSSIISVRGLTKRFGDFAAVDDLSFEVAAGSVFAFLGANGSGKSTSIRMMIGILTPTAGEIEIDAVDVIQHPRRVRDRIGYMGQKVSLYAGLTLRENVEFYAGLHGLAGAALEARWGALRERFTLAHAERERPENLPAGIRQRAGLALATLHQPRVLFLDEPTAGVDVQSRALFWDLIQEESDAGVTVFVTTHFLEEADYCDQVCFIDEGKLIANAAPEALRARFGGGYEIGLELPVGDLGSAPALRAALARDGLAVDGDETAIRIRADVLDEAVVGPVARALGTHPGARVRIGQPEMTDVFRRMLSVSWRRLRTLLLREARATLRDPFTMIALVAVPLAALLVFGFVLSTEVKGLVLGVHDASRSTASRHFVSALAANGTFALRPYASRDALDDALVAGDVSAGLVVPPDFARGIAAEAAAAPAELVVIYDGAEAMLAGNAEGFLGALVAETAQRVTARERDAQVAARRARFEAPPALPGVDVRVQVLFNPELDGTRFMVAGTFGFVLSFLTTVITAISIVKERLDGTFEQLQVTPATTFEILLGKILPLGVVFTLDVGLMMLAGGFLLGVWPAGNPLFFLSVSAFYVLTSLAIGLVISATSATAAEAVQKTVLLSIPLVQLSGFAFPLRNMPMPVQWLAELFPATHYIRVSHAIYLRGEGPLALLPELALLFVFGAALVLFAMRSMERRA